VFFHFHIDIFTEPMDIFPVIFVLLNIDVLVVINIGLSARPLHESPTGTIYFIRTMVYLCVLTMGLRCLLYLKYLYNLYTIYKIKIIFCSI